MSTSRPESSRGLSLAEVMVATGIFMLAALALIMAQNMFAHGARKVDAESDTYRMAMLALRQVDQELRGARLAPLGDQPAAQVDYRIVKMIGGRVAMSRLGHVLWDPGGVDYYTLKLDDRKNLVTSRQPTARLGSLGNAGRLEFSYPREVETHLIEVKVHAEVTDDSGRALTSPYDASLKIYLDNHT